MNQVKPPTTAGPYIILSKRERDYFLWLKVVAYIDNQLSQQTRHYRSRAGKLLVTLDEVVRAIIDKDLMEDECRPELIEGPVLLAA